MSTRMLIAAAVVVILLFAIATYDSYRQRIEESIAVKFWTDLRLLMRIVVGSVVVIGFGVGLRYCAAVST